jgi:hypothetical protein
VQSAKERKRAGREKLSRLIETCRSVEQRSLDPFLIDMNESIGTIKEYFPEWTEPEDLCLDAETIHGLASVIKLQGEWVRHRSTSLYTDPFLLEEKLRRLDPEELVDVFMLAWHPVIEMEQISVHSLRESMRYWDSLAPLDERWKQVPPLEVQMGTATREELLQEKIMRDKAFSEELEGFWQGLKHCVEEKGENGRIGYWGFVGAESYDETVERAFLTSFLVTYGYATLEVYPLEEEIYLKPFEKPVTQQSKKQLVSIPISVSVEDWNRWKRGELK